MLDSNGYSYISVVFGCVCCVVVVVVCERELVCECTHTQMFDFSQLTVLTQIAFRKQ